MSGVIRRPELAPPTLCGASFAVMNFDCPAVLPFQQIVLKGWHHSDHCVWSKQVHVVVDIQLELMLNWEWLAMSLER
jgi:hypothetical protein